MPEYKSPIAGFSVYFVQPEGSDKVKIGLTNDLEARLKSFQTGSPDPFVVLHQVMSPRRTHAERLERELHHRFDDYRYSGEWFRLEGDLAEFLDDDPSDVCFCNVCRAKADKRCSNCTSKCPDDTPFFQTNLGPYFCVPCLTGMRDSDDPDERQRAAKITSAGHWRYPRPAYQFV